MVHSPQKIRLRGYLFPSPPCVLFSFHAFLPLLFFFCLCFLFVFISSLHVVWCAGLHIYVPPPQPPRSALHGQITRVETRRESSSCVCCLHILPVLLPNGIISPSGWGCISHLYLFFYLFIHFIFSDFYFPASGQAMVTGVSSLLPPGSCVHFYRAWGSAIPLLGDFSLSFAHSLLDQAGFRRFLWFHTAL